MMNNATTKNTAKEIVIIGGGFAGINLAKKLAKNKHYHITLVDKNNYNFFPPLIYQVATSFLEISSISYPFRKLFRKKNIQFRLGELMKVDTASKICYLNNGKIPYQYLVFANGATVNYYGNENVKKNAIPMKTVNDALQMRNALLQTLEQACLSKERTERKKLLTIVVAGGGPTGVEVAGMLAELRKYIIAKDYPELMSDSGDIYLIEGSAYLLAQMSYQSHRDAYEALNKLGVIIKLNTTVKDFYDNQVLVSTGETIKAKSLIWAAGIVAPVIDGIPQTSIGKGKRVITDEYNKVLNVDDVYAIGDISIQYTNTDFPGGHPQLAQVAIQQGQNLAHNFSALAKGKMLKKFKYTDKGNMAIIGRNRAVCDLFKSKIHIGGFVALLMWLFVHLMSLINYRNKLRTLYNWTAAYFTRDQSLRMIIRPEVDIKKEQPVLPETILKEWTL